MKSTPELPFEKCRRLGHDWSRRTVYAQGVALYVCVRCGLRDVRGTAHQFARWIDRQEVQP